MDGLQGKNALVTGAAAGIGAAIAARLDREGVRVHVLDLDAAGARERVAALGHGGLALEADIADYDGVTASVNRVLESTLICSSTTRAGITRRPSSRRHPDSGGRLSTSTTSVRFTSCTRYCRAWLRAGRVGL